MSAGESSAGRNWQFLKYVDNLDELDRVRRQHQVQLRREDEDGIMFRCLSSEHCPYRLCFYHDEYAIYTRYEHNHDTVVPLIRGPTSSSSTAGPPEPKRQKYSDANTGCYESLSSSSDSADDGEEDEKVAPKPKRQKCSDAKNGSEESSSSESDEDQKEEKVASKSDRNSKLSASPSVNVHRDQHGRHWTLLGRFRDASELTQLCREHSLRRTHGHAQRAWMICARNTGGRRANACPFRGLAFLAEGLLYCRERHNHTCTGPEAHQKIDSSEDEIVSDSSDSEVAQLSSNTSSSDSDESTDAEQRLRRSARLSLPIAAGNKRNNNRRSARLATSSARESSVKKSSMSEKSDEEETDQEEEEKEESEEDEEKEMDDEEEDDDVKTCMRSHSVTVTLQGYRNTPSCANDFVTPSQGDKRERRGRKFDPKQWRVLAEGVRTEGALRQLCDAHGLYRNSATSVAWYFGCSNFLRYGCPYRAVWRRSEERVYQRGRHTHRIASRRSGFAESQETETDIVESIAESCNAEKEDAENETPSVYIGERFGKRWVLQTHLKDRDALEHSFCGMRKNGVSKRRRWYCCRHRSCPYQLMVHLEDLLVYSHQQHNHPLLPEAEGDVSRMTQDNKDDSDDDDEKSNTHDVNEKHDAISTCDNISDDDPDVVIVEELDAARKLPIIHQVPSLSPKRLQRLLSSCSEQQDRALTDASSTSTDAPIAASTTTPPPYIDQYGSIWHFLTRIDDTRASSPALTHVCRTTGLSVSSVETKWVRLRCPKRFSKRCPYRAIVHVREGMIYHRLQHNHPLAVVTSDDAKNSNVTTSVDVVQQQDKREDTNSDIVAITGDQPQSSAGNNGVLVKLEEDDENDLDVVVLEPTEGNLIGSGCGATKDLCRSETRFGLASLERKFRALARRHSLHFHAENGIFALLPLRELGHPWLSRLLVIQDCGDTLRISQTTGCPSEFSEQVEQWPKSEHPGAEQFMARMDAKCHEYFQLE